MNCFAPIPMYIRCAIALPILTSFGSGWFLWAGMLPLPPPQGDFWEFSLPVSLDCTYVLVVADCSVNPELPEVWGLGSVVATPDGVVLARVQSFLYCRYGSTTLLKLTGVTELLCAT